MTKECKRNITHSYKNSRVVFLNLKNMQKKQDKNMLLETLQKSKCDFSFPNQDLLNLIDEMELFYIF
ncbi:lipopolysaccharide 1,2-glucosyltransferase (rfaJ)-like protein [Rickettsia conorii str. Malish 7]|uniref:Lipopolysaccharide 1,2-glucosyltransferase (RfaJ)-like protein n=1 Tax=Rickettsia conorii (strain ATCC VR-613 / Malish 7) TaxID=272944 RepID=Q92HQ1_RICCN|nr:lipopolysaccharide 1,2-glucosyltransferase (rfaJ)-like protein [Rickettsia conorii str. Malish 7]